MATVADDDAPNRLSVIDVSPQRLTILRRWVSVRHVIALVAAVLLAWRAYVATAAAAPQQYGAFIEQTVQPPALAIGGLVAAYYGLVGVVNRTTIRLQHDCLELRDGPLPAAQQRRVRLPAVRAVEYDEEAFTAGRNPGRYHVVRAVLTDGTTVVVDRIRDGERQAKWLYRRVKRHLEQQ